MVIAVKPLWKLVPALLVATVCLSPLSLADAQKPPARKHAKKKQTEPPLPPYTPATLNQLPLDQVPAVPPEVTYHAGQLSIVAHNSTLGDVLRAVRKETGAEVEIPAGANDRVVTDLGPGPARDVLAKLLNGSHFNYVMLGSPTDPMMIQRIVLTSKAGPETVSAVATPPPAPAPTPITNRFGPMPNAQMQNTGAQPQNGDDADAASAEGQSEDAVDTADDANADQADENQQGDQQNQNGAQTPKTPEQLLQELQRQQQLAQPPGQAQGGEPVPPAGQQQMIYPNGIPAQPPTANAPEQ